MRQLLHALAHRHGDDPYVAPPEPVTALRFPGKVAVLPGGTFLVSDTAHHQLVELDADLSTERRRFGDGTRGLRDGAAHRLTRLPVPAGATVDGTAHRVRRARTDLAPA